jgi:ankyrin repeat protein
MEAACRRGDLEAVKALVSIDARRAYTPDANGVTPVHRAAAGNHIEVIEFLLQNRADPNALDRYGDTPLKRASYDGFVDAANALLAAGADVNRADSLGKTPLHHAAERGHFQVRPPAKEANLQSPDSS